MEESDAELKAELLTEAKVEGPHTVFQTAQISLISHTDLLKVALCRSDEDLVERLLAAAEQSYREVRFLENAFGFTACLQARVAAYQMEGMLQDIARGYGHLVWRLPTD